MASKDQGQRPAWKDAPRRGRARIAQHRLLAWWKLYTARFDYPRLVPVPPGRCILTLAPHPDDDAIWLGGTLVKHHQAGCRLVTLVLTDGSRGVPGAQPAEAAALRRAEQERAAAILGIDTLLFWEEPDGALVLKSALVNRLRLLLAQEQPDLVYLPPFLDAHPDHRVVAALLVQAVEGQGFSFITAIYETTTPLLPNALVEINAQLPQKLLAIGEHRSQLTSVDYAAIAKGLARYRGAACGPGEHFAEAFYIDDLEHFVQLATGAPASIKP